MQNSENAQSEVIQTTASGNGAASSAHVDDVDRSRRTGPTGPRTTQGKERSKSNALKHGIFSRGALLQGESRAEFDAVLNGLRESLQPEGTLEEMLVEKLAQLAWRHRRMLTAETAEIQRAIESVSWEEVGRQAEGSIKISEYSIRHDGGLIRRIANITVLESCLRRLRELGDDIERDGFDPKSDATVLTDLYGEASNENWQPTLFDSYSTWLATAQLPENERKKHGFANPGECREAFIKELDSEVKRLERHKRKRSSMEAEKGRLEPLRQQVPLTPQFHHLIRYEASLERSFDRTLNQLERAQRMRLGQPVLPKLEVHHSVS